MFLSKASCSFKISLTVFRNLILIAVFYLPFISLANTQVENYAPDWKSMIETSDLAGIMEVVESQNDYVSFRRVQIHKGRPAKDTILVSLNNEKQLFKAESRWFVFLRTVQTGEDSTYYSVWPQSAGFYPLSFDSIQYHPLSTAHGAFTAPRRLGPFLDFVRNMLRDDSERTTYHAKLLNELEDISPKEDSRQLLPEIILHLYWSACQTCTEHFQKLATEGSFALRHALAKYMGSSGSESCYSQIHFLLNDPSEIIRDLLITEINNADPNLAATLLLEKIWDENGSITEKAFYTKSTDEVILENLSILETIGSLETDEMPLDFKKLANTDNAELLNVAGKKLYEYDPDALEQILRGNLLQLRYPVIETTVELIEEKSLTKSIPALKYFIEASVNTNASEYAFSVGALNRLAIIEGDDIDTFLIRLLYKITNSAKQSAANDKLNWMTEMIKVLAANKSEEAEDVVYRCLWYMTGIGREFPSNPNLPAYKQLLEDSLVEYVRHILEPEYSISDISALVHLDKDNQQGGHYQKVAARVYVRPLKPVNIDSLTYQLRQTVEKAYLENIHALLERELSISSTLYFYRYRDHVPAMDNRFEVRANNPLIAAFCSYLKTFPTEEGLEMLNYLSKILAEDNHHAFIEMQRKRLAKKLK